MNTHISIKKLEALVASGQLTEAKLRTILRTRAKRDSNSGRNAAAWLKAHKATTAKAAKVTTPTAVKGTQPVLTPKALAWVLAKEEALVEGVAVGSAPFWATYKAIRKAQTVKV